MTSRIKMALIAALAVGIGQAAFANSIQIQSLPTTSPDGSNTTYSYSVSLTTGNTLKSGDFFTLVDFTSFTGMASGVNAAGFTPGSAPGGSGTWKLTDQSGYASTPSGVGHVDSGTPADGDIFTQAGEEVVKDLSATPDLTFQYTGSDIVAGSSGTLLGIFKIDSSKTGVNPAGSIIVGSDHQTVTGLAGQNADPYLNPGDTAVGTPLPAAALGGMSLLGLLGGGKLIRRRRR